MDLVAAAARLRKACAGLAFPEVAYAYDPLAYAWEPHERYLRRYGPKRGRAVLVGMNPGPWGMGQTGIPFADVAWAHGWMGIDGRVDAPRRTHPKRPVLGFAATRSDPSGSNLYGWAKRRFGDADAFFERFFVTNYAPLLFLDDAGRNVTLPQLPAAALARLTPAADAWTRDALDALAPRAVLALGTFVADQVRRLAPDARVHVVRHPSPVNPANNAGWGDEVDALLADGTV